MDIKKIIVPIDQEQYGFSVEVMRDEDETIYRVTPDQGERVLDDVSPGYLEYDEKGNLQIDDAALNDQARSVSRKIWDVIRTAVV